MILLLSEFHAVNGIQLNIGSAFCVNGFIQGRKITSIGEKKKKRKKNILIQQFFPKKQNNKSFFFFFYQQLKMT